jgi:mannitol/fructose-specific phosphotransferase system IIA component
MSNQLARHQMIKSIAQWQICIRGAEPHVAAICSMLQALSNENAHERLAQVLNLQNMYELVQQTTAHLA